MHFKALRFPFITLVILLSCASLSQAQSRGKRSNSSNSKTSSKAKAPKESLKETLKKRRDLEMNGTYEVLENDINKVPRLYIVAQPIYADLSNSLALRTGALMNLRLGNLGMISLSGYTTFDAFQDKSSPYGDFYDCADCISNYARANTTYEGVATAFFFTKTRPYTYKVKLKESSSGNTHTILILPTEGDMRVHYGLRAGLQKQMAAFYEPTEPNNGYLTYGYDRQSFVLGLSKVTVGEMLIKHSYFGEKISCFTEQLYIDAMYAPDQQIISQRNPARNYANTASEKSIDVFQIGARIGYEAMSFKKGVFAYGLGLELGIPPSYMRQFKDTYFHIKFQFGVGMFKGGGGGRSEGSRGGRMNLDDASGGSARSKSTKSRAAKPYSYRNKRGKVKFNRPKHRFG